MITEDGDKGGQFRSLEARVVVGHSRRVSRKLAHNAVCSANDDVPGARAGARRHPALAARCIRHMSASLSRTLQTCHSRRFENVEHDAMLVHGR